MSARAIVGSGLAAQGIVLARGGQAVLRGASIAVRPGELVALLGANGAGKSTLLSVLAGDLAAQAGSVTLDGRPLEALDAAAQACRRAVLTQDATLAFDLGVEEVVAMGLYPYPDLPAGEAYRLVGQALDLADAAALRDRRYPELSGGERQRVQLARALAQCLGAGREPGRPRYLLLDEPAAGLDPGHQNGLLQVLRDVRGDGATGVLVILHDVNLAVRWCDRLALLADGRVVADGPPAEVLTESLLERVYRARAAVVPHPLLPGRPLVLFGHQR